MILLVRKYLSFISLEVLILPLILIVLVLFLLARCIDASFLSSLIIKDMMAFVVSTEWLALAAIASSLLKVRRLSTQILNLI